MILLDFYQLIAEARLDFEFNILSEDIRCSQKPPDGPQDTYPSYDPPPITPKNEILQVYLIMHSITVVKLPERTEIERENISISLDIDSWSWSLSLELITAADFNLVKPDENGVKEIEINIDGYIWEFIVEKYRDNRAFNSRGYTIQGRSKTAYLAAPYKLTANYTETAAKTSVQLVDYELLNTGFTASYNTVSWLVNANAYSYSNLTPVQATMKISGAVGAVILPHKKDNSIDINARYPINPWDWAAATPDATITRDIIRSISGDWQPQPDINAVYVSGRTQGVNCFVKRTGTAGDQLGKQVLDDLITHQVAGRERGRNIIADRGKQELVTIDVPVMPLGQNPGIYEPGALLQIDEGGGNIWKGQAVRVQSGPA